MSVMIGIDPHKLLHAACAIDRSEEELGQLQVRSGPRQLSELLSWATRFEQRTWAIESAGGLGYGSGRSNKNDANDARAVAIAALRSRSVAAVRAEDHVSVLRLLAKAQLDASRARSRACSRLHALVRELVPGGIRKEIVAGQALHVLDAIEPVNATQRQRLELARETLEEIELLDARMKRSKQRITEAVKASGTTLIDVYGIGPIIAATIIGYTGDIGRFPTSGHYAAYNGTAPIEFSSSGRTVHRLSRRGNRTLNHAIHMIAVTQIRHADSEGRTYFDRKVADGRTKREAMRALKRQISDRVYKHLVADTRNK